MTERALTVHVERTTAGDVLRWVCRRPDLDDTPAPPADSLLARMIADGIVESLGVRSGDLLVRFRHSTDIDDANTVAAVHRAVIDALREGQWSAPSGHASVSIRSRRTRSSALGEKDLPAVG